MTYLVRHIMNIRGQLDWSIRALHGGDTSPVVRYSPDGVLLFTEQAWKDIYSLRSRDIIKDPGFLQRGRSGSGRSQEHLQRDRRAAPACPEAAVACIF